MSTLLLQCILSIFPASVHQLYANILVFVNINPFLYINDQFALHNIHVRSFKTFILCPNTPPDNCDKFRSSAVVAPALVGPSEFKSYALKQFFSKLRSVILGISQKRKSHTQ